MERHGTNMSGMSIVTNDEIMEMTQLVFDRYYTELKRQLRRGEIDEESVEQYCTEILSKVYQAIQLQGVAATSYEMDACAIPIINEEIRKILVPLHLNGYRNQRENPKKEAQKTVDVKAFEEEEIISSDVQELDVTELKNEDAVQVISNGEVQVFSDNNENEMSPELRTEIRRILQQEFRMEPAQIKPVVVVVNVTPQQSAVQPEVKEELKTPVHMTEVMPEEVAAEDAVTEEVVTEEAVTEDIAAEIAVTEEAVAEEPVRLEETVSVEPEGVANVDVEEIIATEIVAESEEAVQEEAEVSEIKEVTIRNLDAEPLPQLDFDLETLVQEQEEEQKKKSHLWLWIPIIMLLLVLIWLTIGMLMSYDVIPDFDLGYEWFNETLFDLFTI